MSDARSLLEDQILCWKERIAEARDTLKVGESVLSSLESSLRLLDSSGAVEVDSSTKNSDDIRKKARDEVDDTNAGNSLIDVRRGEEVQDLVTRVLIDMAGEFTQSEVESAIKDAGYSVNSSTLRTNLQSMADDGQVICIKEPGKGRRATIFMKADQNSSRGYGPSRDREVSRQ